MTKCTKGLVGAACKWADGDGCRLTTGDCRFEMREENYFALDDPTPQTSDGSTASYYELPDAAGELQDLISFRNMNAQMGEIFRACYRYGQVAHSPRERDLKKIIFYAQAELDRLARYGTAR